MSKAGVNRVLFRIFDRENNGIVVNGKKVYLASKFNRNENINICGKVMQVPFRLNNKILGGYQKEFLGKPHYVVRDNGKGQPHPFYSNKIPKFHEMKDIAPEVEVGDNVYYYYTTILQENKNFVSDGFTNEYGAHVKHRGVRENGLIDNYEIWSVTYDRIICVVRDGKIIMIGDHVLVEPDMETEDDILHPVYYDLALTGGKRVLKPKKEWLLIKPNTEPKHRLGIVRKIGTPLKDTETYFDVGDRVVYHKNADFPIEIEGKQYYCMKKEHILAKVENDVDISIA